LQNGFRIDGAYQVEPSLNRVTGPGGVSRLEPKVMLVLVCLAEHAGRMVPKDQLFQSAWPDTAVTDDVLTRAVSELRRLFEDDPRQPRVIETIARGGYRLIAPVEILPGHDGIVASAVPPREAHPERLAPPSERWNGRLLAAGITGVVVLTLAGAWLFRAPRTTSAPPMRVVSLTAMSGSEYGAHFSPDGRQIAFAWNGEAPNAEGRPWWQGNWDIYVKLVGASELHRLTTSPGVDLAPVWSPDGREIAYVRLDPTSPQIRVVSSLGGSDRQVSDFPVFLPAAWSPDGRYLVAGRAGDPAGPPQGLYLIPVHGGEPRALTRPKVSGQDLSPAFSPDGRRLAYVSCPGPGPDSDCHLQLANLDAAFTLAGPTRQLAGPPYPGGRSGVTWSRDGRSIIFNATENQLEYLWRVGVEGQATPERIEQAGLNAFWPAVSPSDDRLAFTRMFHDEDVYRFEPGRPVLPVAPSSLFDGLPQFSPDIRRIAFASLRSGEAMEVWIANADGSSPAQLTHGPGRFQGGPSWSPDGRRIAFESAGEHAHIWTVDSEGGTPRQITRDPGDQMSPTWSRDGEWVYFSWARAPNDRDIWRTRVSSGVKERVTRGGGFIGSESMDGKTLLYISKAFNSPLIAQPLAGGQPRQIISCVSGTAFSVTTAGVYYLPCSSNPPDPDPTVRVMNPATGEDREFGRLEKFQYESLPSGFATSPDGRTILYGRLVRDEADLMMIENFR